MWFQLTDKVALYILISIVILSILLCSAVRPLSLQPFFKVDLEFNTICFEDGPVLRLCFLFFFFLLLVFCLLLFL